MAQELTKAERKALFEQQNKAKIEAAKAAKEKEKLSKAERAAIQVSGFARDVFAYYSCIVSRALALHVWRRPCLVRPLQLYPVAAAN